ncbi:MAG: patatin-like phospholipase family protein [Chloroflexi bacterium]|nr:MAG: patatin-like phospholipase family protein [Chloroflexota bacterium]
MKNGRWHNLLPRPIAFVLSGGAALGAIQVGMLKSLLAAGLMPDLLVGTSVGALNGAVIADHGMIEGTHLLEEVWENLSREMIFPGGRIAQARHLLSTKLSIFPNDNLTELICRTLSVTEFEALHLPFGALATNLLTHHGALFTSGKLHKALLASAAIPGVYPPVEINGVLYVDGALTAHVPLAAAVRMGAASLVVLDTGDTCHHASLPRHVAEMFLITMHTAMRQRVLVEAPAIARQLPVLYLPSPCPISRSVLDFSNSQVLMKQAEETTAVFLENAPPPKPGHMSGAPHFHDDHPVSDLIMEAKAI